MQPESETRPEVSRELWYFPRLKTLREDAKLTQHALAELTRKFDPSNGGVSKETLSKMERRYGVTRMKAVMVYEAVSAVCSVARPMGVELLTNPKGGVSGRSET